MVLQLSTVSQATGGAIQSNLGASPTIVNCVMRSNTATFGGAFFADGGSSNTLIDCKFFDNSANTGGAIDLHRVGSSFSLTRCLFVNNTATNGGGLYLVTGVCTLTNCSFAGNSGTSAGGGIWGANANTVIENCIIAFSKQGEAIDCGTSIPTLTCSDLFSNAGGDWVGCIAGQDAINGNFSLTPLFCDTASQDYSLTGFSPCSPQNNACSTLIGALPVLCCTDTTLDSDADGLKDCFDNCPSVFNPGQEDFDLDFVGDSCDTCNDLDGDGFGDSGFVLNTCPTDNCPNIPNPIQEDSDNDGIGNACDNCQIDFNPSQSDADSDGIGDACDGCPFDADNDIDGDGFCGDVDNCPNVNNPAQTDLDGDGVGDSCDICPGFNDNIDTDADGIPDGCDICPGFDDSLDADGDGVPDGCDICPGFDDKLDADADGVPDGCDICPGFNDNFDIDGDGVPDGIKKGPPGDLVTGWAFLFVTTTVNEMNCNGTSIRK